VADEVYTPEDPAVDNRIDALVADGLTVNEVVTVALLNNRDLQAAFYEIGASRADVVQSQLLSNPQLSIVPMFPDAGGRSQFNVSFGQELVDLWQIPVRKKAAQARLDATVLDIARQCIELAANTRSAAYQLLTLEQTETTVLENLKLVERSEQLARARFEAGEASQLDVNLARTNTLDVRLELIQVQRQKKVAQTALSQQMSFAAPARSFELKDTLPEPIAMPSESALLALAMERRLDARAAEHRLRAAEADITRQYLSIFPSITAGFELELPERRALPDRDILADTARESIAAGQLTAPSIESRAQRDREGRQEIESLFGPSFGIVLPIWDQNQAGIATAIYRAEQQRKQLESLANQIATQVARAGINLNNASEIVRFYREEALPQAQLSLDNARQLYEAGETGILAVIDAQQSLVARRRGYVTALGEYAAALAEMELAIGGIVPTTGLPAAPSDPQATTVPADQ
jgi:cobalt-zinc-cadmium efflux system outer membrane protein